MLMIIGANDKILFQMNHPNFQPTHAHYFIVHSSLDNIDELKTTSDRFFLKNIDDSNKSFQIYAYITSEMTKFVYLSNTKDDRREERVRAMFADVHFFFANVTSPDRHEPPLQTQQRNKKSPLRGGRPRVPERPQRLLRPPQPGRPAYSIPDLMGQVCSSKHKPPTTVRQTVPAPVILDSANLRTVVLNVAVHAAKNTNNDSQIAALKQIVNENFPASTFQVVNPTSANDRHLNVICDGKLLHASEYDGNVQTRKDLIVQELTVMAKNKLASQF